MSTENGSPEWLYAPIGSFALDARLFGFRFSAFFITSIQCKFCIRGHLCLLAAAVLALRLRTTPPRDQVATALREGGPVYDLRLRYWRAGYSPRAWPADAHECVRPAHGIPASSSLWGHLALSFSAKHIALRNLRMFQALKLS